MKIAIISDVHGNAEALHAVMNDMNNLRIEKILCLGDMVGYGAYSSTCVEWIREISADIVCGNHEEVLCRPTEEIEAEMDEEALASIKYARNRMSREKMVFLRSLPRIIISPELGFTLAHDSVATERRGVYIDSENLLKQELTGCITHLCFLGHTHTPFVYGSASGFLNHKKGLLRLSPKERYVINVGSVGQSRDGDCRACYGILESGEKETTFSIRRIVYNIDATIDAMRLAGLGEFSCSRLYHGE